MKAGEKGWWRFLHGGGEAADGEFVAWSVEKVGRLYYPLASERGLLSWVNPRMQGAGALDYHHQLEIPLTVEDFPFSGAHRGLWVVDCREGWMLSGAGWNAPFCPEVGEAESEVRAGPGWFEVARRWQRLGLAMQARMWCPADASGAVEVIGWEIINHGEESRRLSVYAAVPLFGRSPDRIRDHRHVSALLHRGRVVKDGVVVRPVMEFEERGHSFDTRVYCVVAARDGRIRPEGIWIDGEEFIGEGGCYLWPEAVRQGEKGGQRRRLHGREAVAGFYFGETELRSGARMRVWVVGAVGMEERAVLRLARRFTDSERADSSLAATRRHWLERSRAVRFHTPDPARDNWLVWVGMQPHLRRIYGNSYLPEFDYGRGGKGWRDLWQDCLALLLHEPRAVRDMILHNFGGVRIDGSNATIIGHDGSFIADRNAIPRTWMDHGVWPVHTTLLYLDQTGDWDLLLEEREYFRDPQLFRCRRRDPEWAPAYGNALRTFSGRVYRGTVLEHMLIQTVTAFYNVGPHNLCRLEGADWNDGLDMASERGESVSFSAFYAWNLRRLAEVIEELDGRGVSELALASELLPLFDRLPGQEAVDYRSAEVRAARLEGYLQSVSRDISGRREPVPAAALAADLRDKAAALTSCIRQQEWVDLGEGLGCFNGYYDNLGRRVEGRADGRVRMTLTGQVFPLMGEIATEEQVDAVIRAVERYLADRRGGIRLNTDFGGPYPELGRAFSFAYGEKENGAVFSHMAVMYAFALYRRRRARQGRKVWHALYRMAVDSGRSRIFPNLPEYFNSGGRGMYCYLTGSAAWLIYLLLTRVYGLRGRRGDLVIDPQLQPEDWDDEGTTAVEFRFADRRLRVLYRRTAAGRGYRVSRILINGRPLGSEVVHPTAAGGIVVPRTRLAGLRSGSRHEITVEC